MKSLVIALTGLMFLSAFHANAFVAPGVPNLIGAEMKIVSADGKLANVSSVRLSKYGTPDQPKFMINLDGKKIEMVVTGQQLVECRSTLVEMTQKTDPRAMISHLLKISLIDHSTRVCRDLQPYRWVADITLVSLLHHEGISKMKAVGNPVPIRPQF